MARHLCTAQEGWEGLAATLARATGGDEIRIEPGLYEGKAPLALPAGIRLIGGPGVVLINRGEGPILLIEADDVSVSGLKFLGSLAGQICVHIVKAERVVVDACEFDGAGDAWVGIEAAKSRDTLVSTCSVFNFQGPGISYLSSTGQVEKNECWGSRKSVGIGLARDAGSPGTPSVVLVAGNHCHDNEESGICFFSSIGRVENNECWGTRKFQGIAVQRDGNSPDAPSDVLVVGNRCHDNLEAGICFQSSTGRVENNECWGSHNSAGIAIQRDPNSLDAPSDVVVVGNRCHDNEFAGISFYSSTGRAENNECWGARNSLGISVQRDVNSPEAPSDVLVVGNRCHDNEFAGISFYSSTGRAENNECWESRKSQGIAVQRADKSPDVPSDVVVVGNRCHNNEEAGIVFFSSMGRAENNQCWAARKLYGIAVQPGSTTPDASSHVFVVDNRCYDNESAGIAFLASTGRAENNECWGNRPNSVVRQDSPDVVVGGHADQPSVPAETLHRQRSAAKPLGAWRIENLSLGARAEALADFLVSGGCRDCFGRFWSAPLAAEPAAGEPGPPPLVAAPRALAPALGAPARLGIYRVGGSPGSAAEIRALARDDCAFLSPQRPPDAGMKGINALLPRLGRDWFRLVARKRNRDGSLPGGAPRWVTAIISADDAGYETWLRDEAERIADLRCGIEPGVRPPTVTIRRFDLAGQHGADGTEMAGNFVEHALLHGKSAWRRWLARFGALVFMPATEAMGALAVVVALFGLGGFGLAWAYGLDPGAAFAYGAGIGGAGQLVQALAAKLAGDWAVAASLGLFVLLVLVLLANRVLPSALRFSARWLRDLLEAPGLPFIEWANKQIDAARRTEATWWKGLRALAHSKASRRLWLRRQLYGYRLFGLRRSPPPVAIVAVCNVDVPSREQMDDLHTILDACPADQPLLLITQMPGLSMLVSGFLDVWFPGGRLPAMEVGRAFVVHDPASATIEPLVHRAPATAGAAGHPSPWSGGAGYGPVRMTVDMPARWPDAPAANADGEAEHNAALGKLATILGWRANTEEQAGVRALEVRGNVLLHPRWAPEELLPMLVIGSTPAMHMVIERADVAFRQYEKELNEALYTYQAVFRVGAGEDDAQSLQEEEVKAVDACAERGEGLLVVDDRKDRRRRWVGRAGYRVALAGAVRDLYRTAGLSVDEAEKYLAEMMACGEIYNLRAVAASLAPRSRASAPEVAARAVLHMEAALFLAEERLNVLPPKVRIAAVEEKWSSLTAKLRADEAAALPHAQWARICSMLLRVRERFQQSGFPPPAEDELEAELERLIDDPLAAAPDPAPKTAWATFLEEVRTLLGTLANREPATAGKLLEAKLGQEWGHLPARFRDALRRTVIALPGQCLAKMGQAASAEELLSLAGRFRERPALVIAGLGILAAADWRRRECAGASAALAPIAEALLRLRAAVRNTDFDLAIPVWSPHPDLSALPAATALLTDEASLKDLCALIKEGNTCRSDLAAKTRDIADEIEGIALGVHGKLHGALKMAEEVDERWLLSV